jgi:hypothetical protein
MKAQIIQPIKKWHEVDGAMFNQDECGNHLSELHDAIKYLYGEECVSELINEDGVQRFSYNNKVDISVVRRYLDQMRRIQVAHEKRMEEIRSSPTTHWSTPSSSSSSSFTRPNRSRWPYQQEQRRGSQFMRNRHSNRNSPRR